MKAAVIDAFGPAANLHIRDIPLPVVAPEQVLVEVHAASVNPIDWKIRDGLMASRYGMEFPMVLGLDVSGVIVELGSAVTGLAVGDDVYARSDNGPGKCYAEYVALNAATVARKPATLSHVQAAAVPLAALTPLYGLRDCGRIGPGDRVLLNGASGGVGVFATQIAKILGAHVTGVCSARNAALVGELGADAVIDYTCQEILRVGVSYDMIYDVVGTLPLTGALLALAEGAVHVTLVPVPGIEFFIPGRTLREAGKGYFVAWTPQARELDLLSEWITGGRLVPVIDSEYGLDGIRQAHERSQSGRAVGKIVIRMKE